MNHLSGILPTEKALIGSVLLDPDILDTISSQISGVDFYDAELGELFSLLVDRHEASLPTDPVTLLDPARRIFGNAASATLADLFTTVPNVSSAGYYATMTLEASRRRQLEVIASDLQTSIRDAGEATDGIISKVENRLTLIGLKAVTKATTAHEAGLELISELETEENRRASFIGIDTVDTGAGGIMPGELAIIAARPGDGKTSLAMQSAKHNAERQRSVLFVSLEMTRLELIARVLCGMSEVDSRLIRQGKATQDMTAHLFVANDRLKGMPLSIYDPPTATIPQIKATAKILQGTTGLDLLVVDYIGLVKPRDKRIPRTEQVSEITAQLKRLAKELGIAVIALCQLNRQADGVEPKLSHLRESGSVEQDADMVVFLHRESAGSNDFKLIIGKHRHGQAGSFNVIFNPSKTRFETELSMVKESNNYNTEFESWGQTQTSN